ncbi:MAG: membrane protein insertion efficiency factor YidD [Chitinivibrionales bacterium]|nr:membrane protein insertion efficiency factor YidD [Chitinivibrionales bacterium]
MNTWFPGLAFLMSVFLCNNSAVFSHDRAKSSGAETTESYGTGSNEVLDFYQKWISPAKGGNTCPMYPSCSQYAKMQFERNTPVPAFIATCRRLIECGHDLETYPKVAVNGKTLNFDPPDRAETNLVNENQEQRYKKTYSDESTDNERRDTAAETCSADYAEYLYETGQYFLAYAMYLKASFHCTNVQQKKKLLHRVRHSAFYAFNEMDFIKHCSFLLLFINETGTSDNNLHLLIARKHLFHHNSLKALRLLGSTSPFQQDSLQNELYFLRSIARLQLFLWKDAKLSADSILPTSDYAFLQDSLADLSIRLQDLKLKNRYRAGILSSIIPGTGYMYAGRLSAGIAAFIINGLFGWSAVEMIRGHHYPLGATIAVLGLGWYLGNIRGSIKSADRHNRREKESLVRRILFDIQIGP